MPAHDFDRRRAILVADGIGDPAEILSWLVESWLVEQLRAPVTHRFPGTINIAGQAPRKPVQMDGELLKVHVSGRFGQRMVEGSIRGRDVVQITGCRMSAEVRVRRFQPWQAFWVTKTPRLPRAVINPSAIRRVSASGSGARPESDISRSDRSPRLRPGSSVRPRIRSRSMSVARPSSDSRWPGAAVAGSWMAGSWIAGPSDPSVAGNMRLRCAGLTDKNAATVSEQIQTQWIVRPMSARGQQQSVC